MKKEIKEYVQIKNDFTANTYKFDGVKSSLHFHNAYEVYYLEKGERDHLVNGTFYHAKVGTFVLISPGTPHQTNGTAFQRRLIHFKKEALKAVLCDDYIETLLSMFDNVIYFSPLENKTMILNLFNSAEKAYLENDVVTFVITLATLFNQIKHCKCELPKESSNKFVNQIADYIQQNACTIKSLDEIAKKFFINKYYLCHLFKKEKQITIISFLQNIKIQKAAYLLVHTKDKISEICYKTGFNSEYYFSKCFSSILGLSPSKYRNLFKNKENP